jgi:hypothetical protein
MWVLASDVIFVGHMGVENKIILLVDKWAWLCFSNLLLAKTDDGLNMVCGPDWLTPALIHPSYLFSGASLISLFYFLRLNAIIIQHNYSLDYIFIPLYFISFLLYNIILA